jgi:hypothetical protein
MIIKAKKEIDFLGQKPYTELPFNMENINNIQKYNSLVIVFEGLEGNKKKYKCIRINSNINKFKDNTDEWNFKPWSSEIILKRILFLLYLSIWANVEALVEKTKGMLNEKEKIADYVFESIMREKNIEYYNELKIILQKLLEKKINRVYIVYIQSAQLHGPLIQENLGIKGYTEWGLDDLKNKNEDINSIATKFFSIKKIKNLRDESLAYIKQLETKYNKQLSRKKKKVLVTTPDVASIKIKK